MISISYLFNYTDIPELTTKTFTLEQKRTETGNQKLFSSSAVIVALNVKNNTAIDLPRCSNVKDVETSTTSTSYTSYLATPGHTTTEVGDVYLTSSFTVNTTVSGSSEGSWILRKSTDGGAFIEIPNTEVSRTVLGTNQYGAVTVTTLLKHQPAGTYYYDLAFKLKTGTSISTTNATISAVSLTSTTGAVFPSFSSFDVQNKNNTASFEDASTASTVAPFGGSQLFIHSTFNMTSASIIDPATFQLTATGLTSLEFTRYIGAGTTGSGGIVGLTNVLTGGTAYTIALQHKSSSTNELTTKNINLVGFHLTSARMVSFTGATDATWNTAGNWSSTSIPLASDNVSIPTGKTVEISAGNTANCYDLSVEGSLTIKSSSETSSGSLIVDGNATGNVTYERYVTGGGSNLHLVSSPVEGQSLSGFATNSSIATKTSPDKVALTTYDEAADTWTAYPATTGDITGNFTSGKGYLTLRTADGIVSFTGTLNTTDLKDMPIVRASQGWNLLGNPYPCALNGNNTASSTNNLLKAANIADLEDSFANLYVWNPSTGSYQTIGNAVGTLGQDYLQAGQGFFVRSKAGGGTFSINEAMRSHQPTVAMKSANVAWSNLSLTATSSNKVSTTNFAFNANMTNGLDVSYDAGMFKTNAGLDLYSRLLEDNGVDFTVQCLPDNNIENISIPLGIDVNGSTTVVFSINDQNFGMLPVYLVDTQENTKTNLKLENYSTTVTESGTGRFYLEFKSASVTTGNVENAENESVRVFAANNTLNILNPAQENGTVSVYNLSGQQIDTYTLNQTTRQQVQTKYATGCYLVQIKTAATNSTAKIIIK